VLKIAQICVYIHRTHVACGMAEWWWWCEHHNMNPTKNAAIFLYDIYTPKKTMAFRYECVNGITEWPPHGYHNESLSKTTSKLYWQQEVSAIATIRARSPCV
jgi:hypothetical protein